jgi:hypothetical protein
MMVVMMMSMLTTSVCSSSGSISLMISVSSTP